MAKRKPDICPFTGAKIAAVRDGPNDTKIVDTSLFPEPVTLSQDLYDDLPGYRRQDRLGMRRWIADRIDAGDLPSPLTNAVVQQHMHHPAPSLDTRANRLMAWMAQERRGRSEPFKEFDFTNEKVDAEHPACLRAEGESREDLHEPMKRLAEAGYIDYVDSRGQRTEAPRLIARLTSAGLEQGGQATLDMTGIPPETVEDPDSGVVHKASAQIRLSGQEGESERSSDQGVGPKVTATTSPEEVERIVIRTVDRALVRRRMTQEGEKLVDLADVLLSRLDELLERKPGMGGNNPPESMAMDSVTAEELEALRRDLAAFRDALSTAIASKDIPVDQVVDRGGTLIGRIKAIADHPLAQRPLLGGAAVGVSALALSVGVPVDPTITMALFVAGPDGVRAVAEASKGQQQ